jgi:hypothetical protein
MLHPQTIKIIPIGIVRPIEVRLKTDQRILDCEPIAVLYVMPEVSDPSPALEDAILPTIGHSSELQELELTFKPFPIARARVIAKGREGQALHEFDRFTVFGRSVPDLLL